MSQKLTDKFRTTQVLLGGKECKDVPNLDVATRWSATFAMVKNSYELRNVFTSIINDEELNESFDGMFISEEDWFTFKTVVDFLEPESVIIDMISSTSNATLSI